MRAVSGASRALKRDMWSYLLQGVIGIAGLTRTPEESLIRSQWRCVNTAVDSSLFVKEADLAVGVPHAVVGLHGVPLTIGRCPYPHPVPAMKRALRIQ
jgi:hypothetical protein